MAKRLSVSFSSDGSGGSRYVDPLFEFDAPQMFVDLTLPPMYHKDGEHDPWFDVVHVDHSKPSDELAQEEAELKHQLQLKQQQHKHHAEHSNTATGSSSTNSGSSNSKNRHGGNPSFRATALNPTAASEKENRIAGRQRRPNVATGLGSSKSSNVGGLNGTVSSAVGTTAGSHVSGLPARLRRSSGQGASRGTAQVAENPSVGRMKAQIKRTTVSAAHTDTAVRRNELSMEHSASRKRGLSAPAAAQRETTGASTGNTAARARFMSSTASSRMAAQKTPSGAATTGSKAKVAPRKAGPSASTESSDLQDLQELLARHNKKFKSAHTYQPPQHSVRDVRMVTAAASIVVGFVS